MGLRQGFATGRKVRNGMAVLQQIVVQNPASPVDIGKAL
jgi:hypothetical protein